jgi:RHS repeat-associated protein
VPGLTRADLDALAIRVRVSRPSGNNPAFTANLDAVSVTANYTTTAVATAPTYDDNGNLLTDGTYGNRTFTYDALGRLTGVTGDGVGATYTLDGAGNRWAETINSVTTSVDLDLAAAYPTILADGTRLYLPGAPGAGYAEAGTWYSGLTDQHGSSLGTVSDAGTVSALRTYDPYGAPRAGSPDPAGIGFTGEWRDATGLVNLRARAYDPVMGRFVGRDTFAGVASAPQTANRYTFGTANPLTALDPSGHFNNHLIMPVRAFVAMGVSVAGPVGVGYTFLSGVIGYDPIAGVSLTTEERVLFVAPVVGVGAIAAIGPKLARAVPRAIAFVDDLDLGARARALARTAGGRLGELGGSVRSGVSEAGGVLRSAYRSSGFSSQAGQIRLGRPAAPYVRSSLPPLATSRAEAFEGAVRIRTLKAGESLYRSPQLPQETPEAPGSWFSTRRTSTRAGTESQLNGEQWGNPLEELWTYRVKTDVTVYYGKVAGGTGYQVLFPRDVDPGDILDFVGRTGLK